MQTPIDTIERLTFDLSQADGQITALRKDLRALEQEKLRLARECEELKALITNFQQSLHAMLKRIA